MDLRFVEDLVHEWRKRFVPHTALWLVELGLVVIVWWQLNLELTIKAVLTLVIMGLGASFNSGFVDSFRQPKQSKKRKPAVQRSRRQHHH